MALYLFCRSLGSSLNLYIPLPMQPTSTHTATTVAASQCRKTKPITPMHPPKPIPIREPGSTSCARLKKYSKATIVRCPKMYMYAIPIRKSPRLWNILSVFRWFCNRKWKIWNTYTLFINGCQFKIPLYAFKLAQLTSFESKNYFELSIQKRG